MATYAPSLAGSLSPQAFQGRRARVLSVRCVPHLWENPGLGLCKTHLYSSH